MYHQYEGHLPVLWFREIHSKSLNLCPGTDFQYLLKTSKASEFDVATAEQFHCGFTTASEIRKSTLDML